MDKYATIQYVQNGKFIYYYGLYDVVKIKFDELKKKIVKDWTESCVLRSFGSEEELSKFLTIKRNIEKFEFIELK